MIGWATGLKIVWRLLTGASATALGDTTQRLIARLADLQSADSEVEKAEIEREVAQLQMLHEIQKPSTSWRWSPMYVGQFLVVVPFGLWWASVFIVSVLKPMLVDGRWAVDDVPPHLFEMAAWLIPAVIVGTFLQGKRK